MLERYQNWTSIFAPNFVSAGVTVIMFSESRVVKCLSVARAAEPGPGWRATRLGAPSAGAATASAQAPGRAARLSAWAAAAGTGGGGRRRRRRHFERREPEYRDSVLAWQSRWPGPGWH